jgi:hypothetical protein
MELLFSDSSMMFEYNDGMMDQNNFEMDLYFFQEEMRQWDPPEDTFSEDNFEDFFLRISTQKDSSIEDFDAAFVVNTDESSHELNIDTKDVMQDLPNGNDGGEIRQFHGQQKSSSGLILSSITSPFHPLLISQGLHGWIHGENVWQWTSAILSSQITTFHSVESYTRPYFNSRVNVPRMNVSSSTFLAASHPQQCVPQPSSSISKFSVAAMQPIGQFPFTVTRLFSSSSHPQKPPTPFSSISFRYKTSKSLSFSVSSSPFRLSLTSSSTRSVSTNFPFQKWIPSSVLRQWKKCNQKQRNRIMKTLQRILCISFMSFGLYKFKQAFDVLNQFYFVYQSTEQILHVYVHTENGKEIISMKKSNEPCWWMMFFAWLVELPGRMMIFFYHRIVMLLTSLFAQLSLHWKIRFDEFRFSLKCDKSRPGWINWRFHVEFPLEIRLY